MRIHFDEQDVVDAVCVWVADRHGVRLEDVDVDLQFDPQAGFAAEARANWRHFHLNEQDMVDAIAFYLAEHHQFIPDELRVDLQFTEGVGVEADVLVA